MTARELYEYVLIELNKQNAPNILLEAFNYFANKSINLFVNKRYNIYDINLQTTDDLSVLKDTAVLIPVKVQNSAYNLLTTAGENRMANYEVTLPPDYLHLLNCVCIYQVQKTYKCYNAGEPWRAPATRLTADMYSLVLDNYWTKPTYKKPYYYIHNINTLGVKENELTVNPILLAPENPTLDDVPEDILLLLNIAEITSQNAFVRYLLDGSSLNYEFIKNSEILNPNLYINVVLESDRFKLLSMSVEKEDSYNTSGKWYVKGLVIFRDEPQDNLLTYYCKIYKGQFPVGGTDYVGDQDFPESIQLTTDFSANTRDKEGKVRYGGTPTGVRMEIRYGTDDSVFNLTHVQIDYLKAPQYIRLTQKQIDMTEDTSQILEFPEYICQEILNELVHIIMEHISEPRLQTHPVVSQSIANPAQQLAPEAAGSQTA